MSIDRRTLLCWAAGLAASSTLHGLVAPAARAAVDLDVVQYAAPAVRPTYINIFLYGGPSELGANLSNLAEIQADSLNAYPANRVTATANGFWEEAGGAVMETLLAAGDLSIYRTIYRRKDDSKGHHRSVTQNLGGALDVYGPGMATTLSALLEAHGVVDPASAVLPVITFEGDSRLFDPGNLALPAVLRPVGLAAGLDNPYDRSGNGALSAASDDALEALAQSVGAARQRPGTARLQQAFDKRRELAAFIAGLDVTTPPAGVSYPTNNPLADRLLVAIGIAVANPDTYFISLGNGGLGGWDAHSDAIDTYTGTMTRLMEALAAAAVHLRAVGAEDRIVINVFGDFGRNVNLNDALGWDHGNNQNLYTLGGKAYRTLGQVVGSTVLTGSSAQNRLYTAPAPGSPEYEPFAIASSVYGYFGVQNPRVLTGEAPIA